MAHHQINQQSCAEIRDLRIVQDSNAKALGMLLWEFEEKRLAYYDEWGGLVDLTKLGALLHEFDIRKQSLMETIRMTQVRQRLAGERALRDAGLDPDAGDYIIDRGHALKLIAGQYVEDF